MNCSDRPDGGTLHIVEVGDVIRYPPPPPESWPEACDTCGAALAEVVSVCSNPWHIKDMIEYVEVDVPVGFAKYKVRN